MHARYTPAHMRLTPMRRTCTHQVREHLDAEADYERGRQGLEEVRSYMVNTRGPIG